MARNQTLYLTVIDKLIQRIKSGDFDYNSPFVTEGRITNEYGVSRITARRALEELEKKGIIYRRCRSGSFVTHNCLELLNSDISDISFADISHTKTSVIAIVFPFESVMGGMMQCLEGISDTINSCNCSIRLYNTRGNYKAETELLRSLIDSDVDGIILSPLLDNRNIEILSRFVAKGIPIVLVDKHIENIPISYVVSDNYGGAKALCDYAIENGHSRIGFLSVDALTGMYTLRERYRGYDASMTAHRLKLNLDDVIVDLNSKHYIEGDSNSWETVYHNYLCDAVKKLHRSGVTALLCQNDWIARDVIYVCSEFGISVPDELMVMGFDNANAFNHIDVADKIITMNQNFYEMGKKASEIIMSEIAGKSNRFMRAVIPVSLVEGRNATSVRTNISSPMK